MASNPAIPDAEPTGGLKELARLRRFEGPPAQFWPAFIAAAGSLTGAHKAALIVRDKSQPPSWKKLGEWAPPGHADRSVTDFVRLLPEIGEQALEAGALARPLGMPGTPNASHYVISARLPLLQSTEVCIAAFLLLDTPSEPAGEALTRLMLASDTPLSYQVNQVADQARGDVEKFAATLDLLALINAEKRFIAASLALCNGAATRFKCDRVSLGWLEKGYIRLQTISRTEKFDSKMAAVKALETAMEEALDQDDEVVFPAPQGSTVINRDHEKFETEQAAGNVASIPIRVDGDPVAVLTCERKSAPFTPLELQQFRLTCDQLARRFAELKRMDRWFGARMATELKEKAAKLVGPEHTGAKLVTVIASLAVLLLLLPIWRYRVEGNFILRSDDVTYLTTPFDGYIREVQVRPGDLVKSNSVLLRMNTSDLLLEESAAMADLNRYLREVEKSRATNSLAEMRISESMADQVRAKLDLVRYRLKLSEIRAPFEGVLVEGDLRQRVGSPVKQGDALFKIARNDQLYIEAEVNERDVPEILNRTSGEIAFVSQPKLKFPFKVVRIEPAATVKKEGNIFVVRCAFVQPPAPWWRPGMSGLAKIEVDRRSLFWILTHRTVDFLRLQLWW
jgi:multidrug efflux pump subunit AcrA (membrane-fusion protein)